ncbi:MAG: o-succinylbenzoate synthase [Actinomycetota bacterium]|nr:o-succinylbenzoate synthase [Actinomycetota bacterium]
MELRRVRLPLVEPWRWEGGVLTDREVVLVRAQGPDSEGWGECTAFPAPTYSPEWTDGAWDVLRHHLVPLVLGAGLSGVAVGPRLSAVKGNQMAKAAVELAVLDAELQAAGVSLARRLGGTRDRVTAGVVVGLTGSLPALVDGVAARVDQGYRRVKLKIHPGWDVEPVLAVRARFAELQLMVDANGSYQRSDAAHLRRLDAAGLLCLEQPLEPDDLVGHAALAAELSTPVCLDESVTSLATATTAIALGACRVVNIKAGRVGGYLEAVRIHDLCRAHGLAVWCGGMLETGIGRSANLALASLPGFSYPGDLSASDRFFVEDICEPVVLDADGTIAVPDAPGIGAVLRPGVVDAATVDRLWFSRTPTRGRGRAGAGSAAGSAASS